MASNRGENTIGIFAPGPHPEVVKTAVGVPPNGLAYDAKRRLIVVANLGDLAIPGSYTLPVVDLDARQMRTAIPLAGTTRGALYDPDADAYYAHISDPPQIVVAAGRRPTRVA